jgi:hypothetical protein
MSWNSGSQLTVVVWRGAAPIAADIWRAFAVRHP